MKIVLNHFKYGRLVMANGEIWDCHCGLGCDIRYASFINSDGIFVNLPINSVEVIANA